ATQRAGNIVNIASLAGLVGVPLLGSYAASKFAVVGLSKALRLEAKRYSVGVSVVCPGIVRTPILDGGRYGRRNEDAAHLMTHVPAALRLACDVDWFARRVLRGVDRNRGVIVEPLLARLLWRVDRLSPALVHRATGILQRRLERSGSSSR